MLALIRQHQLAHVRRDRSRPLPIDAGVSLLEILIVVAIMGLLATAATLQLSGVLGRAKGDTARLQLDQIAAALEIYRLDQGRYPSDAETLTALVERPSGADSWRGPYLRNLSNLRDPWGRNLVYQSPDDGQSFKLTSLGADGRPGGEGEARDVTVP